MSSNPYPLGSALIQTANLWGVDPRQVFAFAGVNARSPSNPNDLSSFYSAQTAYAQSIGVDSGLLLGWETEGQTQSPSKAQVISWAQGRNYMDTSGNLIYTPVAGLNYIGDSANFSNPVPGPGVNPANTVTTQPSSSTVNLPALPGNIAALLQNKTLLIGGAVVAGVLVLRPFGHGRR